MKNQEPQQNHDGGQSELSGLVRPVAVLAGTYAQFREYAQQHPHPKPIFCGEWPRFAGIEFSTIVEIGTFRERADAIDIYQRVLPMVRPNV